LLPTNAPDFYRVGKTLDPGDLERYHFWSLHPGGAQWALADGSVRFLLYSVGVPQNNVTRNVLESLATRAGGEAIQKP
jgi:prepilin-type processing-associated H-X9-DG protein